MKYEGKPWQAVFPQGGDFPEPLRFEGNIDYVREVLAKTINYTRSKEDYVPLKTLNDNANYFKYQKANVGKAEKLPSHKVIEQHIKKFGTDYRYETKENPVPELRNRKCDNIDVARKKQ